MYALVVGFVKFDLVPCIVDVLLGNCLKLVNPAFLNHLAHLCLGLGFVPSKGIVKVIYWTVAVPAAMLHLFPAISIFATVYVPFLCVAFQHGNSEYQLAVPVALVA